MTQYDSQTLATLCQRQTLREAGHAAYLFFSPIGILRRSCHDACHDALDKHVCPPSIRSYLIDGELSTHQKSIRGCLLIVKTLLVHAYLSEQEFGSNQLFNQLWYWLGFYSTQRQEARVAATWLSVSGVCDRPRRESHRQQSAFSSLTSVNVLAAFPLATLVFGLLGVSYHCHSHRVAMDRSEKSGGMFHHT